MVFWTVYPDSSEYQAIVQVQEVKNNETEEIEMNEINTKSLDISVSDPEGMYPRNDRLSPDSNRVLSVDTLVKVILTKV